MFHFRKKECFLGGPTHSKSLDRQLPFYGIMFRQHRGWSADAVDRVPCSVTRNRAFPFILRLLYSGRPPAIFRRISGIVINAFNCEAGWLNAHISKEISKIAPPVANGNAPAAVVFPTGRIGVGATLNHIAPANVRGCASGLPVLCDRGVIFAPAVALTCANSCKEECFPFTAFTVAYDSSARFSRSRTDSIWGIGDYCELAIFLANNDHPFTHNIGFFSVLCSNGHRLQSDAHCDSSRLTNKKKVENYATI